MTTDVRGRCGAILLVVNLLILILATPAPVSAQKNLLLFGLGQRTTPKKTSESATWQQWDAFLTFAITKIGQMLPPELRGALADLLLNARYELADALVSPTVSAEALVPQLFFSAMQQLSPALRRGLAGVTTGNASQISHFANAVDSMNAFGPMGFRTGLVKLTPNTLRGLAYMVNPGTNQGSHRIQHRRRSGLPRSAGVRRGHA